MPRYYMHIYNDVDTTDEEGADFADDQCALDRAVAEARGLAAESVRHHGHLILSHRIDVMEGSDRMIGSVYFRDVVEIID